MENAAHSGNIRSAGSATNSGGVGMKLGSSVLKPELKHFGSIENSSPSGVTLEGKVLPPSATPTLTSVERLRQLPPLRERNLEDGKRVLPPHIKVPPKTLFGYPERYRSPTDLMVSPVSRGLLTRNRRPARTLAPVPPKALEITFQDVVVEAVGESDPN